ncbi:retinoblastoma-related protein 2-like isoform X1 [Lolium perenne]|uniref:retinoblastoma-related protein 2-like isoform X1 n=1 Tax=Lolium perenne TaxID=4522 RepID=UPI0021F5E96D|nr:retinoblastoma-related protein 2-like [Lolium perenne]XP_051187410.1 retinoblastoma-related protein 2-like [Lolium perenne]XP_051187411.1 retinoblastoma-related protein 2-like [Lolium perenne]XP_051187413.1 retinoblastoma-related protein 2-like [Lolium perenne]XP_051187414.1 retinoblastoma-related protein 2-like [Lolium perenne]
MHELGVDKGVASEAAALLEEGKGVLLTPSSFGSKSPQDVERLCFAFVLYCAARLKGMKEGSSRVRLWKILEGCNLNYDDFFKESQQFRSKIDQILRSRYGSDWEDQLELKQLQSLVNLLADASRM